MTTIIYVNYYSEKLLIDSIESVYSNTAEKNSFRILVANNGGSLDELVVEYPEIKIIECKDNYGFGKANNLASRSAKSEYLLFLNPDTILMTDIVSEMTAFFDTFGSELQIGALGGSIYDFEGNGNFSSNYFPTINKDISYLAKGLFSSFRIRSLRSKLIKSDYKRVDAIIGCNLFIKRSVFEDISGFDENFFMYFEDVDFCYRLLKEKKLNCYVLSGTKLVHLEGGSSKGDSSYVSYKTYKFYIDSLRYYIRKNSDGLCLYILRRFYFGLVVTLNILFQGLSFRRVFNFTLEEKRMLLAQILQK